jgi:thiamine-phosphate pyrophosphorylase
MKPIVCYVTDRKSLAPAPSAEATTGLLEKIRMALNAGVDWIQIREKDLPGGRLLAVAREAVASANRTAERPGEDEARVRGGGRIYVNNRLDVALGAGAAGVHLGGESLPVEDVVRWCRNGNVPAEFQIGVSCHSIERAREAERSGANHIFFGPVFDTPSKRGFGPPQGIERLGEVCRAVQIPVIAIGGVKETNAEECIRAGAWGIAAIRFFQDATSAEGLRQQVAFLRGSGRRTDQRIG